MSEESSEMKSAASEQLDKPENSLKSDQEEEEEEDQQQDQVELGLNDEHHNFEDEFQSMEHHSSSSSNNNNKVILNKTPEENQDQIKEDQDDPDVLVATVIDDTGLYDDVMAEPAPNLSFSNEQSTTASNITPLPSITSITSPAAIAGANQSTNSLLHDQDSKSNLNQTSKTYVKRVSCYVGNLTWWTTDKGLSDEIQQLGITDLLEIKFYENKINGQSKGFCMVTVGSDQSFRILMDKLPKKQLNGQEPLVTHYSRHYFNQFEEQARKDMPSTGNNANNSNNHNDSFNPQQTGSFHHYNHNTSLGSNSVGGGNNHLNGNSNSINNVNSNQLHSQPIMQNRNRTNSYPVTSSSSASTSSLNNGLIGAAGNGGMSLNNRSLNNTLRQQATSLVGNYSLTGVNQSINNSNQLRMPLAQQQMGMMPNSSISSTSLINNSRQFNNNNNLSSSSSANSLSQYNNQRPMLPNQQTSLLGNRPPLLSSQPMIRPSLVNQQQQPQQLQPQQSHGMNQMSLLNNPRIPPLNVQQQQQQQQQHNQPNSMQLTRQDSWDNRMNNSFNNNVNPMLIMNNQRNNPTQHQQMPPITPTLNTPQGVNSQFSYSSVNNNNINNNGNSNGILPINMNNANNQALLPNSFQSFQASSLHQQPNVYNPSQQQQQQLQPGMSPHLNHHLTHHNPALSSMSQTFNSQPSDTHLSSHHLNNHHHPHSLNNNTAPSNPMQSTPVGLSSSSSSSLIGATSNDPYSTYHRTNSSNSLLDHHHHQHQQQQQLHLQQPQHLKINEIEFQEALEKNRIISGSAISRAVQDATIGQYQSALDTLQTAISLIKQSKISHDERCKLLISTLQDTKKGIEDRFYSSGSSSATNGHMLPHMGVSSGRGDSSSSRADSRDRDRLKRSRSRDSRSRDRDRDRERERDRDRDRDRDHRSKRGGGTEQKHHRSSHRDRSRERSRATGSSMNGALSSSGGGGGGSASGAGSEYYEEQSQHSSSRYHHRSRH